MKGQQIALSRMGVMSKSLKTLKNRVLFRISE